MVELTVGVKVVELVELVKFTGVELVNEVATCQFQFLKEAMGLGIKKQQ